MPIFTWAKKGVAEEVSARTVRRSALHYLSLCKVHFRITKMVGVLSPALVRNRLQKIAGEECLRGARVFPEANLDKVLRHDSATEQQGKDHNKDDRDKAATSSHTRGPKTTQKHT